MNAKSTIWDCLWIIFGAIVVIILINMADEEAARLGQPQLMPQIKAELIMLMNYVLAVTIGTINDGIAVVYPHRWTIGGLLFIVGGGWFAWRLQPNEAEESEEDEQPQRDQWNERRSRRTHAEL